MPNETSAAPTKEAAALPCPFCAHVGLDFSEEGSTYRWAVASCAGCGATTGEVRKHDGWRAEAIAAWNRRAGVAAAPAVLGEVPGVDPSLLKFYGVTTAEALIAAQARHIEKLQAKLPPSPSFAPQRVREG